MKKLTREFYKRGTLLVAKELLGKYLVVNNENSILKGKIVEVEAYMGTVDKAAHSYSGKITERTKVMYKEGGYAYVYLIYGMYYCMNVVTSEENLPEAILIRAIEPINELDTMCRNRYGKSFKELNSYEKKNITNGPGKLCKAMNITKELNGEDLCGDKFYILQNVKEEKIEIVSSKRIGIDYAEEAKDFLWRFYIKDNKFVSKLD
ncbi:putative 3-methyladenine DNA glycosylase [Clostridium homopropionicum DSM 5847]|uniref:Putative 3-methyladenine DNA glycosylase n=1 Tax=Clostridium homopropionicum DSM 5847 TaxID=1121318 RepID=A0A0L6ZB58_9CLOT|nr:DNA-3-methyladenine glycosylase [Clostridium homopropionicum]KOA20206.1 putative 3-methyladenine DNA glycosylase [Clostridium homopropionicum DSM 5847]SFG59142.1 DNA-3-methyladenine glycosylase [Clostridium homopropionicum]